jgi:hypothetical protein
MHAIRVQNLRGKKILRAEVPRADDGGRDPVGGAVALAFFNDAFARLRSAGPGVAGIAGCPFLVFYGEVSDDSDGPKPPAGRLLALCCNVSPLLPSASPLCGLISGRVFQCA